MGRPRAEEEERRARRLREAGWTYRAIAEEMGRSESSVYYWLNREQVRLFSRCPRCGGPTSKKASLCGSCKRYDVERRYSYIARRWSEGWSLDDLAAALGTSRGYVQIEMHRMRREGWDLPYRRVPR